MNKNEMANQTEDLFETVRDYIIKIKTAAQSTKAWPANDVKADEAPLLPAVAGDNMGSLSHFAVYGSKSPRSADTLVIMSIVVSSI